MNILSRFIKTTLILASLPLASDAQTLHHSDAQIVNVLNASNYRLNPNPADGPPIVPFDDAEHITGAMGFDLSSDALSSWKLSFLLPRKLVGLDGNPLGFSYDESSGYFFQGNSYFNPTQPTGVTTDSSGRADLGIGMRFATTGCPIDYACAIVCVATRIDDGFTLSDTSHLTIVNTRDNYHSIEPVFGEGSVQNLSAGVLYTLDSRTGTVSPTLNGAERSTRLEFIGNSTPYRKIKIFFSLPKLLWPQEEGAHTKAPIECSYPDSSAWDPQTGELFNPASPSTHASLADSEGGVIIDIGMKIKVADSTTPGTYRGDFWCTIISPGTDSLARDQLQSSIAFTVTVLPPLPKAISLRPNFPNPFNSSTTIQYDLPSQMNVSLKIYDLLGREISTLVNGNQNGGEHRVAWDAGNQATGVYYYRLNAGGTFKSGRMVLIR
jgi:hypothetical protein